LATSKGVVIAAAKAPETDPAKKALAKSSEAESGRAPLIGCRLLRMDS